MTGPASPYAHVSDPMYWLWLGAKEVIPGVRLGGIYANNSGYHNTRRHLLNGWPNSYSIRLDMDKKGSADLASGLDLTMGDAEMQRRTNYLRSSDLHPDDNRLRALREFIGTRDSEHVYCRIAGNEGLGQRHGVYDSTRDSSHLWHIHISVLRAFAASWAALEPVLSVLAGETWEQWQARKGDDVSAKDVWQTDGIVPAPRVDGLGRPKSEAEMAENPHWWAGNMLRNGIELSAAARGEQLAQHEALMAALKAHSDMPDADFEELKAAAKAGAGEALAAADIAVTWGPQGE